MDNECAICGSEGTKTNKIRSYSEVRQNPDGFHDEIRLCESCVKTREVASWSVKTDPGRRLHGELDLQMETPGGRYTYLDDDRRLHLLRLRTNWVSRHAASVTS